MNNGKLYINFVKTAPPIADFNMEKAILEAYKLVDGTDQDKELQVSNFIAIYAAQYLCAKSKMIAEKIVFMFEGVASEMKYQPTGSVVVNLPLPIIRNQKLDLVHEVYMKNIVGF